MSKRSFKYSRLKLDPSSYSAIENGELRLNRSTDKIETVVNNASYEIVTEQQIQTLRNKFLLNPVFNTQLSGAGVETTLDLNNTSTQTTLTSSALQTFLNDNIIGTPNRLSQVVDVDITDPENETYIVYDNNTSTWITAGNTSGELPLVLIQNVDNNTVDENLVGFVFDINFQTSGTYYYTIYRRDNPNINVETGRIILSKSPLNGTLNVTKVPFTGDAGVTFSIDALGQVKYTSSNFSENSYYGSIEIRTINEV